MCEEKHASLHAVCRHPMALLLATYKHGQLRSREGGSRRLQLLPHGAWFSERLEQHGLTQQLEPQSVLAPVHLPHAEVLGVMRVRPGVCFQSPLTPFDPEADLQWRYFSRPEASYTVEIQKYVPLQQPLLIHARKGDADGKPMDLVHWIFQPSSKVSLSDIVQGEEQDTFLGIPEDAEVPVLWVVEAIASLIRVGCWKSLVLHFARTKSKACSMSIVRCLSALRDLMDWPPQQELDRLHRCKLQFAEAPQAPLTEEPLVFLLQCVRRHAAVLVSDGGAELSDADLGQRRALLESAVEGLEVYAHGLRAASGSKANRNKKASLSAQLIIDSIRAARHLRNRGFLAAMKDAIIESFMPVQLQTLARSVMFTPPSSSTISRYQARGLLKLQRCVKFDVVSFRFAVHLLSDGFALTVQATEMSEGESHDRNTLVLITHIYIYV